ncbi:hypothetical protein D5S18_17720 [Nocardia panacis]|uniref:Uncharacterized protein n=1 Tax=Nocardia panacis TaxID=2340916 RepID=A0A3A4L0A2_9NOCA|nr:hypothetical protein D5S18_17720 [Nocardia panacis]
MHTFRAHTLRATLTLPIVLSPAVAGCAANAAHPAANSPAATSNSTTSTDPELGTRIPLGDTGRVVIPADAVMDIKAPAALAGAGLRCTVVDAAGRNQDLRSAKRSETIRGEEWVTLWTFSAAPNTELTVGCKDPTAHAPADAAIRVLPRGTAPR